MYNIEVADNHNYFVDDVLVHNCHHAVAPSAMRVLAHFPQARICGATATPDRADGCSLGLAFDRCVSRYEIDQAVHEGYLVPVRAMRVEVEGLDLSAVRTKPIAAERSSEGAWRDIEDLHPGQLGRAACAPEAVEGVVSPLMEIAGAMKTVVFAVNRKHASALVASLNARRPGCARSVDGSMKKADRDYVLSSFAAGEYQFLINCQLLVEGWDLPSVECVALARPTTSRVFVTQAIGRALRLHPGKQFATVIDFTTASSQFSLVGPEDVLGGAMVGPTVRVNVTYERDEAPVPEAAYVPPVEYVPAPSTPPTAPLYLDEPMPALNAPTPANAPSALVSVYARPRFVARFVDMMGQAVRKVKRAPKRAWKWLLGR